MRSKCAVLFSGGTDSTCAAALCAETFDEVHLLTFYERATQDSPVPKQNVERLRAKYGAAKFVHRLVCTDTLVRRLSYEKYAANFFRHGFFLLATPGFSSLSWHLRMIQYCLDHKITHVRDGMTQELLHLPGHMPEIRELFKRLYRDFGIDFDSPVITWEVPPDQRLTDRLIVDRHGFSLSPEIQTRARTTGTWLFEHGVLPITNVKGSLFDQRMQHDCYPFVVYNILIFWLLIPLFGWDGFKRRLRALFEAKIAIAKNWLNEGSFMEPVEAVK